MAGETVGETAAGHCILLGVAGEDGEDAAARLAGKVARLRVFENEDGKFDRSLLDTGGQALVVSQFTLIADSKRQKGTRPDFSKAARPEQAEPLYELFCQELREPRRSGADGRLRGPDAGRARQRRAGHDHPRDVVVDRGGAPSVRPAPLRESILRASPSAPMRPGTYTG